MFKKLKWLYERRQYRKAMQNAMALVRYTLPYLSLSARHALLFDMFEFIDGYRAQFGEDDGLATFFDTTLKHLYHKEKIKYD